MSASSGQSLRAEAEREARSVVASRLWVVVFHVVCIIAEAYSESVLCRFVASDGGARYTPFCVTDDHSRAAGALSYEPLYSPPVCSVT